MPAKKITKSKTTQIEPIKNAGSKQPRVTLKNVSLSLSIIFFVIWITIGVFISVVIVQSFRQGAFAGLFGPRPSSQIDSPQASQTILPGVGIVDVECVKSALTPEIIQKISEDGNTSNLTEEEKQKLEPCILKAEDSPSPSPAN